MGFSDSASGKEPARQCRKYKRLGFDPWVGEIWSRKQQPAPVFLPRKLHGQKSGGLQPKGLQRVGRD